MDSEWIIRYLCMVAGAVVGIIVISLCAAAKNSDAHLNPCETCPIWTDPRADKAYCFSCARVVAKHADE